MGFLHFLLSSHSSLFLCVFFSLSVCISLSLSLSKQTICSSRFKVSAGVLLLTSMKSRIMPSSSSSSSLLLKQEFLKKWMKGLQIYSNLKKNMTVTERKKAIKSSADVAIASTRNAATHWSRAVMAAASAKTIVGDENKSSKKFLEKQNNKNNNMMITCSKNILRRSHVKARRVVPRPPRPPMSVSIAKKLVQNRTLLLKRLVPGGQQMDDEICLIKETLDYIESLRVQVDVMRHLAAAAEKLDSAPQTTS